MDLIHTKAFLSPLSGFLILPSSTQEERSKTMSCNLDDLPRLYVIGNIQNVNKKISHLELGLRRYDSSDVVIEDMMQRKYAGLKGPRKGRRTSRVKEKEQVVIQKYGRLGSDEGTLRNQKKIAQKKMITEKNKLVELYHYPGYHEEEMTPLPNGIELNEILEKVIRAQSKSVVGKTKWAVKMLHRFFDVPSTRAVLLDSFWWQFLHLYHPNREIQGHLFERIAENYASILLGNHRVSNQECILKFFPSLLSQAVYICFCSCFPRSWFNTSEFKAQLCDVFFEWLGGTLHEPRSFNKWDYSQLEPERSRREDLMSKKKKIGTGTGISFESYKQYSSIGKTHMQIQKIPARKTFNISVKKSKKTVSGKKYQKQLSKEVTTLESEEIKHTTSSSDQLKEDNEKAAWSRHQNLPKKKLKIAMLPRESHPACYGPELTWHRFNISGHSPLIQHYFQKHGTESKSGCDIFLSRREIYKPMPDSVKTYAEVIKESFHILHQKHKAFRKCYWQQYREMRNFDEQNKCNQELYRQAIKEEMKKRKAQKQKELLSLKDAEPSSLFSKHSSGKHRS
ncbi:protein FAM227A isoform X1 [Crotalus tigris]|uniref:protein FAM227A isoform X1 n=1 Tax=Crotalus tigris TaxID=88082 RepID=UPI00192F7584|nr:protein FAM227A isoform X1 [Crotalus tigris]XP_039191400.1 protein FAM227A isoform X1 [Crotalus tigris]XP_039191401.1 protein FAM227A isoform X1 [Crotalus tigris]